MSTAAYDRAMAQRTAVQQQEQRAMAPAKVAQGLFRDWCGVHGTVVEIGMAADLVRRIEAVIVAERASLPSTGSTTP